MLKVLLLGAGRWGMKHVRTAASLPVDLFVADPHESSLREIIRLGLPESRVSVDTRSFANLADAVVIATPAQTHFELAREFLIVGKDVFVEKPLAMRASEAEELIRLAQTRRRILQVGHIFRFEAAAQWLRDQIRTGGFGAVKFVRTNFSGFKRPRTDTGVLFADAIHFIDLTNYLLDCPPLRVWARLDDFMQRKMDDQCFLALDYPPKGVGESGENRMSVLATVEAGYHLPRKTREVIVVGTRMSATCEFTGSHRRIQTIANQHVKNGDQFEALEGESRFVEVGGEEPLLAEWRAFLQSIETRRSPITDGWSGCQAVRVAEAAIESARTGRTVNL